MWYSYFSSLFHLLIFVFQKPVFFTARIGRSGKYAVLYQYYQPNYPRFSVNIVILNNRTQSSENYSIPFCPANVGCRDVFMHEFVAAGAVEISFQVPEGKELWIVSFTYFNEDAL